MGSEGILWRIAGMKHPIAWSSQWISYLTAGLLFVATVLRSLLIYQDSQVIIQSLGLLMAWLALMLLSETPVPRQWRAFFPIYLVLQTILTLVLLYTPGSPDYYAILFAILSMQIMQRLSPKVGAVWVGLFTLLMVFPLTKIYSVANGIAFALIYTAADVILASYARALRRAQTARAQNQTLAQQLQEANRQLQVYAAQHEKLALARERRRLARELHDSATQTIFGMTLATQSALLLLERDPSRVGAQLDRLNQLAQSALAEIRTLVSELRPDQVAAGGLAAALRRHLAERQLPETLSVSLEVEGERRLSSAEEECLFRIAQEALNNIVKHAQASQARIRLHLAEPLSMEIQDQGCGFDLQCAQHSGHVGLISMRERAAEIGWNLQVTTSPGAGTRIRVQKPAEEGA